MLVLEFTLPILSNACPRLSAMIFAGISGGADIGQVID
jgi:hypothetical protein